MSLWHERLTCLVLSVPAIAASLWVAHYPLAWWAAILLATITFWAVYLVLALLLTLALHEVGIEKRGKR